MSSKCRRLCPPHGPKLRGLGPAVAAGRSPEIGPCFAKEADPATEESGALQRDPQAQLVWSQDQSPHAAGPNPSRFECTGKPVGLKLWAAFGELWPVVLGYLAFQVGPFPVLASHFAKRL